MTQYLTTDHKPAPRHVTHNAMRVPTRPLIARNDAARLAELDLYPHTTAPGTAPLGYTDWAFDGSQYSREPAGTEAERDAAAHDQYLDSLQCTQRQGMLELAAKELLGTVDALFANASLEDQLWYKHEPTWRFRDPRVQAMCAEIPLTEAQMIAMFESAATR